MLFGTAADDCPALQELISTYPPIPSSNCLLSTPLFLCIQHIRRDSLGGPKGFLEMATYVQTVDVGHFTTADVRDALTREVRRGLIARPRWLSPWMFYDADDVES
jgi:hypothetical protein